MIPQILDGIHEQAASYEIDVAQGRVLAREFGINFEEVLARAHQAYRETPYPWDFIWREVWRKETEEYLNANRPRAEIPKL